MAQLQVSAFAKVNLFLELRGRRADGFHELDTVFCELDWSDQLHIATADCGLQLECDDPRIPSGEENLIVRAIRALERRIGELPGLAIQLEKRLPFPGGVGGGSADAAAVLCAANELLSLALSRDELESIAAEIGSDVPFFVAGGLQRGRGRGEILSPILSRPRLDLVVLTPPISCPTAEVFRAMSDRLPGAPRSAAPMLEALATGELEAISAELFNRLESAAFSLHPELARRKSELLEAGCLGALLCGSGAALFGIAPSPESAQDIAQQLTDAQSVGVFPRSIAP